MIQLETTKVKKKSTICISLNVKTVVFWGDERKMAVHMIIVSKMQKEDLVYVGISKSCTILGYYGNC